MRAMLPRRLFFFPATLLLLLLLLLLAACSTVRQGVIVEKRSRAGMLNVYATHLSFRYAEPDVYWVRIEGPDCRGRIRQRSVVLFRHDWRQLRVGDHWSADRGFSPREASDK